MSLVISCSTSVILEGSFVNAPQVYVLDQRDPAVLNVRSSIRISSKTELFYFHLQRREERRQERLARRSLLLAPAPFPSSTSTAITGVPSLLLSVINPPETGATTTSSSYALNKPANLLPRSSQEVVGCACPSTPEPTRRVLSVADFDIHNQLGKGGFGSVYRATDKVTGVELALKVMPKASSRFRLVQGEHHAMRAIVGMPGFVQLYASWHDTVNYYLAMEFVPHGDINRKVMYGSALPVEQARIWMAELVVLLGELHAKGLIHRDIKPDNLLVNDKGHLVLADFGLARDFTAMPYDLNTTNPCLPCLVPRVPYPEGTTPFGYSYQRYGTLQSTAPEVLMERAYSYGADIWSAGITLFAMIFGRTPFRAVDGRTVGGAVIHESLEFSERERHAEEFQDVRDLLTRMLEKDPADRPSVEDIKAHPFFSPIDWKTMSAHRGPSVWRKPPPTRRPNVSERASVPFLYGQPYAHGDDPWTDFTFTAAILEPKPPCYSLAGVRWFFTRVFTRPSTPQPPRPVNNATSSRSPRLVKVIGAHDGRGPILDLCGKDISFKSKVASTTTHAPKFTDRMLWWWADVVARK